MKKNEFQTERTKIIGDMLDNPGECNIYPTGKCFEQLDLLYDKITNEGWISVADEVPKPEDLEVDGYSEEWVNLDYNPAGMRSCCHYEDIDGFTWSSAKWSSCQDGYCNDEETAPTHWRRKLPPPK